MALRKLLQWLDADCLQRTPPAVVPNFTSATTARTSLIASPQTRGNRSAFIVLSVGFALGLLVGGAVNLRRANTPQVQAATAASDGHCMRGNVFECIADGYAPYAAQPASNPIGDPASTKRAVLGGGWRDDDPERGTLTYREGIVPAYVSPNLGLRCASHR
ncbi:MAG: SUMF1/EgtB/PvdO family nonheme iron enzyme [Deltaproteobacteria bacterium]|nr:SUMF1/EgtB/PvdO family nonheme iron enzyme [Deltaproteobacteria bacterium]